MRKTRKLAAEMIRFREGVRQNAYNDHLGLLTIGIGHRFRGNPKTRWSMEKVESVFQADLSRALTDARLSIGYKPYESLTAIQQAVLTDMVFQLGLTRLRKFRKTIAFIKAGKHREASQEMLDSRWAKQTPYRARENSVLFWIGRRV